jgi:hypothetical protein
MGKYKRRREGMSLGELVDDIRARPAHYAERAIVPSETISYLFSRNRLSIMHSGITAVIDEVVPKVARDIIRVAIVGGAAYGAYRVYQSLAS